MSNLGPQFDPLLDMAPVPEGGDPYRPRVRDETGYENDFTPLEVELNDAARAQSDPRGVAHERRLRGAKYS